MSEIIKPIYAAGFLITTFVAFIGFWIYCIATYGFLLGVGFGWFPSLIAGIIIGAVWPLLLLGVIIFIWVTYPYVSSSIPAWVLDVVKPTLNVVKPVFNVIKPVLVGTIRFVAFCILILLFWIIIRKIKRWISGTF